MNRFASHAASGPTPLPGQQPPVQDPDPFTPPQPVQDPDTPVFPHHEPGNAPPMNDPEARP